MARPAPRDWIDAWPSGHPCAGAPTAASWAAELAALIDEHLRGTGESVDAFAARAGVSPATVRRLARGTAWPTLRSAVSVVAALSEVSSTAD